ncbi:MAG: hypothetical protein GEU73_10685 [Chloroflexi bacterium]|nr:hypothetical protein [Chloroflexota bacterium]
MAFLNSIEGVSGLRPAGVFYAFPNVTGASRRLGFPDADALAEALLYEAGVAVLPRSCFGSRGPDELNEYVRLSFATSADRIDEGIGQMKRFIEAAR